jgi:hypothetical protein
MQGKIMRNADAGIHIFESIESGQNQSIKLTEPMQLI